MKLLLVEDEPLLLDEIASYLTEQGFRCERAETYSVASEKIALYQYDVVVLDITLPDGNGLQLLSELKKARSEAGVLIISAKDSLGDRLTGLDQGADDYLTKPFHLAELNARLNALIRRKNFRGSNLMIIDEIQLDTAAKTVSVAGQELTLTKKEYELLLYFVVNTKRVLSQQSIAEHLWGDAYDMADNYHFVYVHTANLRKKLLSTTGWDYIRSVYGMGYKWSSP